MQKQVLITPQTAWTRRRLRNLKCVVGLADARRIDGIVCLGFTSRYGDADDERDEIERLIREPVTIQELSMLAEGLALGARVVWA